MKHDRLFQILYILLNEGKTKAQKLADQFEVSKRTIYRDIDSLSMAGIPIYTSQGKNGGISILENFTLDKSLLTEKEQNIILFGLNSIKVTDAKVDLLLSKLGTFFNKNMDNWIEVDFSRWGYRSVDTERFELLRRGILNKRIVKICYISGRGEETIRDINPLKLVFKQNNWYLQAYCQRANDYRTFKISRIKNICLTDKIFNEMNISPPQIDGNDIEGEYENRLSLVKFIFSPNVAHRVYDEFSPDDIKIEDNGNLMVTTTMPNDFWTYNYVLSFGEQVEIIEPVLLKKEIREYLIKMQKHLES